MFTSFSNSSFASSVERSTKGSSNSIVEDGAGRLLLEASDSPLSASLSVELVNFEDSGIDKVEDVSGVREVVEASIVVDGSVG